MAIYHLSVKPVQRSKGRSATAAAAYRAGEKIQDERTGQEYDYTRRQGVVYSEIVVPTGQVPPARADLWNMAEKAEKRKDGTPAREYEIALPDELNADQRKALALDFAQRLADRHGIAADVCIHAPDREGDQRNHHAHILTTTRQVAAGELGEKADIERAGRNRKADLMGSRQLWEQVANEHLERAQITEKIDHRSLEDQGIDRQPTVKMGWRATEMERQNITTSRGDINRQIRSDNQELTQARNDITGLVIEKGKADLRREYEVAKIIAEGKQAIRGEFEAYKLERERQQRAALEAGVKRAERQFSKRYGNAITDHAKDKDLER